jgi:hypothetical protein
MGADCGPSATRRPRAPGIPPRLPRSRDSLAWTSSRLRGDPAAANPTR